MRYTFKLFLFAVLSGPMTGQVTIDDLMMPMAGDSVELFVDPAPSPDIVITEPGGDEYWLWILGDALSQSVVFDTNDRTDLFPFANMKATTMAFENYYDIRDDAWLLSGQVGQDPFGLGLNVNLFYQPGFREYYAPVAYEDSLSQSFDLFTGIPLSLVPDSILSGLPLIPDSMRARIITQVVDKVDAWGTLNINNGEAEALRVMREQRVAIRVEAKISILPWTDVTDLLVDFLDFLPFDINLNDTLVSYQYLAPGYTLPLAEVTIDSAGVVNSVTYQQPLVSSVREIADLAALDVYPNPASDLVTVTLNKEATQMRIYDLSGVLVKSFDVMSEQKMDISTHDLPPGIFLVTTWNNAGMLTGMEKLSVAR